MAQRPGKRTPEVIQRLLDGIADGVTLRALCRQDGMPNWRTVYAWMEADAELAAQVARARDLGFDAIAEDVFDIADSTRAISEHVQLSKMRIETRMKLLACWNPKKYGNKASLEHSGPDGGAIPVENTVNIALAAVRDLRALRFEQGTLPAPEAAKGGDDLL